MKKKHLFLTVLSAIATMTMTSCIDNEDDKDNTYTLQNYFTIRGSYPNYKLYGDNGGIITPSVSSVNSMTGSKGFGDYQRAFFYMTYTAGNFTEATEASEAIIDNATLISGTLIDTREILDKDKAELNHVMDSDSIAYINDFSDAWAGRGYITLIITSDYQVDSTGVGIIPTAELVYDTTAIEENQITLLVCYNRHKTNQTLTGGITSFATSYDATALSTLVPGTDNIKITFVPAAGGSTKTLTVPRNYLKFE